jgi:NADH:ubiquinone reductase (non-electrogenic)
MAAVSISGKQRVLILGTGWGGASLLRALRRPDKYSITVASSRDHMLFTPLLASTATGALEHRSIIEPIRPIATRKGATFITAEARHIEHERNRVMFQLPDFALPNELIFNGKEPSIRTLPDLPSAIPAVGDDHFFLEYDALVVAVGAKVNSFGVPGVDKHALFLKEAKDARAVRKRIHNLLEAASLPIVDEAKRRALLTFVVCGAGPTGVELTAELGDWLRDVSRSRRYGDLADLARVVLVEASGEILSTFDKHLQSYALGALRSGRIEVRLGSKVKEVLSDAVVLESAVAPPSGASTGEHGSTSERLPCGMVVWSAGVGSRDLIKNCSLGKNTSGTRLLTDAHLLCTGVGSNLSPVFAIGDCASIDGNPLVPIAQVAEQQGIYLAHLLDKTNVLRGTDIRAAVPEFEFFNKGMLAYVGGRRGVASVSTGPKTASRKEAGGIVQRVVRYSGHAAWITWKLAYLSKLGSFRNKVTVPIDWLKTWLFGRDVSSF